MEINSKIPQEKPDAMYGYSGFEDIVIICCLLFKNPTLKQRY